MRRLLELAFIGTAAHVGAISLFRRQRSRSAGARRHILVIQGGSQLRPSADEIGDAVVSVMMGGVLLDLRETELTRRPARVDILAIMGGVHLVVPGDWKVQVDVAATLGGIRDRRTGRIDAERPSDLLVSGRVVMGGLEISSEVLEATAGR